jgi:hypothetical protein
MHPLSAIRILQAINDSMEYSPVDDDTDDEGIRYTMNQNATDNEYQTSDSDQNNDTDSDE